MPTSITQAQVDAFVLAAMNAFSARQGARSVTFADQSVTFESWDEIWKWLAWMQAQVSGSNSRTRYAATSKGV